MNDIPMSTKFKYDDELIFREVSTGKIIQGEVREIKTIDRPTELRVRLYTSDWSEREMVHGDPFDVATAFWWDSDGLPGNHYDLIFYKAAE